MVNRVVIGDWNGTGDYRIRVSKPTFDVLTSLDRERLGFDSNWKDGAVIYRIGTATLSGGTVTVPFGETLPEIPFMYFWKRNSATLITAGGYWTQSNSYRGYYAMINHTQAVFLGGNDSSQSETFGFLIFRSVGNG